MLKVRLSFYFWTICKLFPFLNPFIRRNIYIACGGSQHGSLRQFLALLASFCFTCYWHGGHYNVMGMVVVFFVLLQFEVFVPIVSKQLGLTKLVRIQFHWVWLTCVDLWHKSVSIFMCFVPGQFLFWTKEVLHIHAFGFAYRHGHRCRGFSLFCHSFGL